MPCCGRSSTALINLFVSAKNALFHAAKTGKLKATKEVIENRLAICNTCEFKKNHTCRKCGCYIVLKSGLDAEKCPIGKW